MLQSFRQIMHPSKVMHGLNHECLARCRISEGGCHTKPPRCCSCHFLIFSYQYNHSYFVSHVHLFSFPQSDVNPSFRHPIEFPLIARLLSFMITPAGVDLPESLPQVRFPNNVLSPLHNRLPPNLPTAVTSNTKAPKHRSTTHMIMLTPMPSDPTPRSSKVPSPAIPRFPE